MGSGASGPRGAPVHALVRVWELRRGSGGEGEFSPGLSDGPARTGGGRPRPREESLEVHPAGEEFFPAVAVLLMNRPALGAGGLRALPSPGPRQPRAAPAMAATGARDE